MAGTCSPAPMASICGPFERSEKAAKTRFHIGPSRRLHVGCGKNSGYYGNPGSTSGHDSRDILRPYAADRDARLAPGQSRDPGEPLCAETDPGVALGCGVAPRSDSPVIRPFSPVGLELATDRGADDESWRRDSPGQMYRHIVRPQVHTRGAGRDGDIRAVVHQDRYLEGVDEAPSQLNQLPRSALLEPEL